MLYERPTGPPLNTFSTYISDVFARVIYDPDFEDNVAKTLASLQLTDGKFVDVVDEDDRKVIVCIKNV